jgi:NAD(P)H dehydrogenase (quinone)
VAVTGAGGGVGSRAVRSLLYLDHASSVVALTREPAAVPKAPGLTARYANYEEPGSLPASLQAVDTLIFISSDGLAEEMREHHANVVSAASEAGVGHVVYTSIIDISPESGFYYSRVHRDTEAMLADSGLSHSLARTSIFADYFVSAWVSPALPTGTLALPAASGRMSLVSRDDVARALASLALRRTPVTVELTGPAALTAGEVCRVTEAVTGREIRYSALNDSAYRELMSREGAPDWLIGAYSTMFASVRAGRFASVSGDIPDLTGAPQQSYEGFLRASPIVGAATR